MIADFSKEELELLHDGVQLLDAKTAERLEVRISGMIGQLTETKKKEVKCPACGQAIEYLDAAVTEKNIYHYEASDFQAYENVSFDIDYFQCPHCQARFDLNPSEEAAIQALEGSDPLTVAA